MRRLLTGLLSATLVLGACGDDDDGDRAAVTSIPDETTSSTTTEPPVPPPDVIPTDLSLITEEYVEQVYDALLAVSHEALVLTMRQGEVGEEAIAIVRATTPEPAVADALNELLTATYEGFEGIKPQPEAMNAEVQEVIHATPQCIFAEVRVDDSGLLLEPTNEPSLRSFVHLTPATADQIRSGLNPTAWTIASLPATVDGSEPDEPC